MDPNDESRHSPKPQTHKTYEDPHFHDEDPELAGDDDVRKKHPASPQKPSRRIPPPRKRHFED